MIVKIIKEEKNFYLLPLLAKLSIKNKDCR